MNINWTQASTQRGLIWLIAAAVGFPMAWLGKDPTQLIMLASGIAGGIGVLVKD